MRSRLILTLAFALAGIAAAPMLFAASRNGCSVDGSTPVTIAVINRSQHEVLDIFWVDYSCNEVAKGTLLPGQRWDQQTFISHPFRIREEKSGRLLREFVTSASTPVITFVP
jgi:hypothetical protein